jgi:shikimate dehydrogenase
MKAKDHMNRVGLIGFPVGHSVSPAMHNAAFEALGLTEWHYELLLTPLEELPQRLQSLKNGEFMGANVTIPHKQNVMPHLDSIVMAARSIDAVNTIVVEDERLVGHNTDSAGFILDLEAHGVQVYGMNALVLGAGGAAHSAALGLANRGATVTVMARREAQAWELRNHLRRGVSFNFKVEVQPFSALPKIAPTLNLIVNCTPLGMEPRIDETVWDTAIPFPSGAVVYDMVYRPRETRLLREAKAAGLTVISGLGMLIYQGALAFELWTGQPAPIDIMRHAAEQALEKV